MISACVQLEFVEPQIGVSLERECVLRQLQTDKNPYRNCTRHNCCCQERLSERKAPCCYTGALRYSRLSLLRRRFTNVHKLVLPLSFPPTIVQPFVCFLIFVAVGFCFLVAFFSSSLLNLSYCSCFLSHSFCSCGLQIATSFLIG